MSERVRWTCPNCNRAFSVPTTEGLTVCPQCVASQLPVPSNSADASVQSSAVRQRTASVFAAVVSVPPVILRWCLASLPKLKAIPVVVVLAILGCGTIGFLLGRLSVSTAHIDPDKAKTVKAAAKPTAIPKKGTPQVDPDKALAVKLLNENLDDGNWEEVKWWPPVDQTKEIQQMIAYIRQRIANPKEAPPKIAIDKRLLDRWFLHEGWDKANIKESLERKLRDLETTPRRVARLKYRAKNSFGAMTLHDDLIIFYDHSITSVSISKVTRWDWPWWESQWLFTQSVQDQLEY